MNTILGYSMGELQRFSVAVEAGAALFSVLFLLFCAWKFWANRKTGLNQELQPLENQITRSQELFLLGGILFAGVVLRMAFADTGVPGPLYMPLLNPLRVNFQAGHGDFWKVVWAQFSAPGTSGWIYDSPLLMPVTAALSRIFGLSISYPTIEGTFWFLLGAVGAC